MIVRSGSGKLLFLGRARRHGRDRAREMLERMATGEDGKRYLRSVLGEEMSAEECAGLGEAGVLDALAARVAQGKLALVPLRPMDAKTPWLMVEGDDEPPPEEAAPPPQEEKKPDEWLEIVLMDDGDPPEPAAGAKYRVELDNGTVIEGYLDDGGKARIEGVPKGSAKVSFPEFHADDWKKK